MSCRKRLEDCHKLITVILLIIASYGLWHSPKLDKRDLLAEQLEFDESKIKELIGSEHNLAENSSHTLESCFDNIKETETPVKKFLIRPRDCQSGQTLLIMVKSSIVRGENRRFIRSTWGKKQNVSVGSFQFVTRTVFIVGRSKNEHFKDRTIRYENKLFDDILQIDSIDGYSMKNLVDKSLSLLRFSVEHCSRAKFFLIADDDAMLAPWLLPKVMPQKLEEDQLVYGGFKFPVYVVPRTLKTSKFALPEESFPCASLPPYITAFSLLLSYRAVETLLIESQSYYSEKLIDDVYLNWLSHRANVSHTYWPPDMLDMHCLSINRGAVDVHSNHEILPAENILALHDCDTIEQLRQAWHRFCDAGTKDDDSIAILHSSYCSLL